MSMINYISKAIEDTGLTEKEFGDIVIYLMHHGVLSRPEEGTHSESDPFKEKELYDNYLLAKNEINDYLSVIGMDIYHNEEFRTLRLYPPDSDYPGSKVIRDKETSSTLMRKKISQELAASLIILYLLYEENSVKKEEDFTVVISDIEFMNAFRTKLNLDTAEKLSKSFKLKEDLFKELKQLRAIKYNKNYFNEGEDYPLVIRPLIYDLVPEEVIKSTLEEFNETNENKEV
jgi:hypothetical protein